jgi:hypothetical protein
MSNGKVDQEILLKGPDKAKFVHLHSKNTETNFCCAGSKKCLLDASGNAKEKLRFSRSKKSPSKLLGDP